MKSSQGNKRNYSTYAHDDHFPCVHMKVSYVLGIVPENQFADVDVAHCTQLRPYVGKRKKEQSLTQIGKQLLNYMNWHVMGTVFGYVHMLP